MAFTLRSFVIETQLSASPVSIIQAGSEEQYFIGHVTFTNTSSGNVIVTVWRLNNGTTATSGSGGNWLVKKTIAPGKTWVAYEVSSHTLGNSQDLVASADVASVVNVDISGTKES